jgi:hypothetical protein
MCCTHLGMCTRLSADVGRKTKIKNEWGVDKLVAKARKRFSAAWSHVIGFISSVGTYMVRIRRYSNDVQGCTSTPVGTIR